MTLKVTEQAKRRAFYGWFALAGAMLIIFVVGGAFFYGYGVFLPVMCREFGWSRASVGAGLSLTVVAFGLPGPLYGMMVARFGPRINLVLGNGLAAVGIAAMFFVQEVWHIYVLCIIIGLGAGIGGYIPGSAIANNWFVKKRPLALGMFNACGGLGGFVFAPMLTATIGYIGWRLSWVVTGGIVLVVGTLIGGLVLVRNRPEDIGQFPDGASREGFESARATDNQVSASAEPTTWQARQTLRLPTTWFIAVFVASGSFIMGTISTHQVAYIQDSGFNAMTAAMTMSIVAVSVVIGSLGFGTSALKYNIRYLASAGFAVQLIALVILLTTKNLFFIYIYAVLIGIGHGVTNTAMPVFVGAYYRRDHYARVLGIITPFQVVSQAVAAFVAGAIYDTTGVYIWAFALIVVFSVLGLVCAFLSRRPKLAISAS